MSRSYKPVWEQTAEERQAHQSAVTRAMDQQAREARRDRLFQERMRREVAEGRAGARGWAVYSAMYGQLWQGTGEEQGK